MRTLFWNVRGIAKPARRKQVKEYISSERLDCVGLQETKKQVFLDSELRELNRTIDFTWKWIPSQGLSGGIIMGVRNDCVEIEEVKYGNYYIAMSL